MQMIARRSTLTQTVRSSRLARVLAAFVFAGLLSVIMTYAADGPYNLNPVYCHNHTAWDPLWWIYQCWLPDPPGDPMT